MFGPAVLRSTAVIVGTSKRSCGVGIGDRVVAVEQFQEPDHHFFDIETMHARARELAISQRALAKKLGVDKGTVIRWVQGHAEPSPRLMVDMAAVLDLAPEDLYKPGPHGRDLAYYRVLAGYSMNALSPLLRLSNASLRAVERGEREPSARMYEALLDLLNLDDSTLRSALSRCRPGQRRPRGNRVDLAPARLEASADFTPADQRSLPSRVFFRPQPTAAARY